MTYLLTAFIALILASGGAIGTPAIGGVATWYDAPSRTDAAAGPAVRELLGPDWRGQWVKVTREGVSVTVRLTDWCACGPRDGHDTLLDLDDLAFSRLASLGTGVIEVEVEPVDDVPPPTDCEGPC